MAVGGPLELIDAIEGAEHPLVLSTEVQGVPLGKAIGDLMDSSSDRDGQTVTLVIGPEAGFSSKEIETLRSRGAEFVSLGRLVLRTETAALVAAAIVMHRLGEIG
jgi:16S rRNA (uracil1498-N3)-methyltransferase